MNEDFDKIRAKKEELFYYQTELGMGHKDLPNYFKCETCIHWMIQLWSGRRKFQFYEDFILTKGYGLSFKLDVSGLIQFINDIEAAAV